MAQEFSTQIDAFDHWKADIGRALNRFRLWLRRNELFNEDIDQRLFKLQESLKAEYLTVAFVGEFSRGKTELINSLFFADYGQRVLPSEAGRTTMCPTELFYDRKAARPYLRLLPIETRLQATTLEEYRRNSRHWTEVPLMTGSASEMTHALHTITQVKTVDKKTAIELGFDPENLEPSEEDESLYEIPAWRHALVSFPHPLLKQGLCILDTPGLNALGSEPELTLKLLPKVQAVVFILGADTGVTASDMAIWDEYIKHIGDDRHLGVLAVLNKIDTLWDELSSRKKIDKALKRMVKTTARQLQIDAAQVFPISAQKALVAKVKQDKSLLIKSQIQELEHELGNNLLRNKERVLWESVIQEAKSLVEEALQLLSNKAEQLAGQRQQLRSLTGENKQKIDELIAKNEAEIQTFERKLMAIRPSQRLLERQTQILLSTIGARVLSKEVEVTLQDLVNSKTTVGLFKHMKQFYIAVESIQSELNREAELTNKMAISLYRKFADDFGLEIMEPRLFPAKRLTKKLRQIIADSERLNNQFYMTFTEHSVAVKRFFSSTVSEVIHYFKSTRQELISWTQSVINPMTQQLKIQQHMIKNHREELAALKKSTANIEGRIKALNRLIDEIDMEARSAEEIKQAFDFPEMGNKQSNVVSLSKAARKAAT